MANDLHEALSRFNVLPDDAVLPSQVTAIILGVSERTVRYHTQICRESKYRELDMDNGSATFASCVARECHRRQRDSGARAKAGQGWLVSEIDDWITARHGRA